MNMLFRKLSRSRWLRYSAFAFLGILALIATYYAYHRRATTVSFASSNGAQASMDTEILRSVELLDVKAGYRSRLPLSDSRNTVVIILAGGDCPNMLNERRAWADLMGEFKHEELQVIGVLVRTSLPEAKTFLNGFDFPFQVFLDEDNELKKLTDVPSITPFKLLLQEGSVMITEGPRTVVAGRETFADKVRSITRGTGGT